jgi:Fic family protein
MKWNGEQPGWPDFTWEPARLRQAEQVFLLGSGIFTGTVKHLGASGVEQFTIEAMSWEALTTSEIEGEILDRVSVQSSIRKQFGLATEKRNVKPPEQGIAEMMIDVYRSFAMPLSAETLFRWHGMLMKGRTDLSSVGRYRTDDEPMQVVSGGLHAPKVHFEAPPSARVPGEMAKFVK